MGLILYFYAKRPVFLLSVEPHGQGRGTPQDTLLRQGFGGCPPSAKSAEAAIFKLMIDSGTSMHSSMGKAPRILRRRTNLTHSPVSC
jgi:hypothetical protein